MILRRIIGGFAHLLHDGAELVSWWLIGRPESSRPALIENIEYEYQEAAGSMSVQALSLTHFSVGHVGRSYDKWLVFKGEGICRIQAQVLIENSGMVTHFRAILPDSREVMLPVVASDNHEKEWGFVRMLSNRVRAGEVVTINIMEQI